MNLIELKEKIAAHLATLTIDDYYLDPSLAETKALFQELTKCENDKEIEEYLVKEIPNTDYAAYVVFIEESIKAQQSALAAANQQLAKTKAKQEAIAKKLEELLHKQTAIPEKQKEVQAAIDKIDAEVNQISPLSSNAIYVKRIKDLEKEKSQLDKLIKELPNQANKLDEEIASIKTDKKTLQHQVNEEQVSVNILHQEIYKNETLLKEAETKKTTHFKEQKDALNFLLGIFLGMKAKNSNYLGYNNNELLERLSEVERRSIIINVLGCSMIPPKDWRSLLNNIFSSSIPNFSGSLATPDYARETYLVREKYGISSIDLGTILALRVGLDNGYSIQLQNNLIGLTLSGGLMAKIEFRGKHGGLAKFQKSEIELFVKGYQGYNDVYRRDGFWRNKFETLYHHTGYANSRLEITIPHGYYILTGEYVIDITFEAAPMLLGAEAVGRFAPNIAGKAKKDQEREDQEEEDRRREEEDWD